MGELSQPLRVYSYAAHAAVLLPLWFCVASLPGLSLRVVLFSLSFFFIAYWLVSIFIYLFKKGRHSTFTRIIQRFWKRALYLFWLLEVGLFCIYLFLTIISPQEVSYMLDNQQLFFSYNNNLKAFFESLLRAIIIILLANLYLLSYKYNTFRAPIVLALTLLLVLALFDDFVQFYSINQHYSNYNWNHAALEIEYDSTLKSRYLGVWEQELAELKLRPYIHYLYLLVFLKLWHTLFIVYTFLMLENIRLYTGITSFNILSANLQNFYFLLFFNFILKISFLKSYFNYLGGFVYYWFFVNYNSYDFSHFYSLFKADYLAFVVADVLSIL